MPTIAIVDGVAVVIYPNDHEPPHIHARFGEFECRIAIVNGKVLSGDLPRAKLARIKTWLSTHHKEVSFAWEEIVGGRGYKGKIT